MGIGHATKPVKSILHTNIAKGHMLWNAGKIAASYLEENATDLVHGKTVLELGAGAGLPSLVCALKGARKVVATDYPDQELIRNLEENVSSAHVPDQSCVTTQGFLWGNEPKHLIEELPEPDKAFDLLILADLIFNHSEHRKLISTIQSTLRKGSNAQALVFFTPHRPWLLHKDLAFFDLAKEEGLIVEKIVEEKVMKAMFDKDYGDEELRRTVFGYRLRWT